MARQPRVTAAAQRLAAACPRGRFLLPVFAPAPTGGEGAGYRLDAPAGILGRFCADDE